MQKYYIGQLIRVKSPVDCGSMRKDTIYIGEIIDTPEETGTKQVGFRIPSTFYGIYAVLTNCAHLGGRDWIIVDNGYVANIKAMGIYCWRLLQRLYVH